MIKTNDIFCRIYYFKADAPVTVSSGENKVRILGGNTGWTEIGSRDYHVKLKNLCAARNAAGNLAYCVFTSECLGERTIDDVIRHSLLGARFPAGLYEF
jgi:hypothetical protein